MPKAGQLNLSKQAKLLEENIALRKKYVASLCSDPVMKIEFANSIKETNRRIETGTLALKAINYFQN